MPTTLPAAASARVRLHYLDGIRGLAALYVTLAHLVGFVVIHNDFAISPLMAAMLHGKSAVAVFIVLSGYSLMLPLSTAPDGKLRGGLRQFLARRARRILPPYYAALGLTMLFSALWKLAAAPHGADWNWIPDGTYSGHNITLHLLLLHNFSPRFITAIDPPTWSVAVEWQIYFVFAALLVPIWQRFGNRGALLFSLFVGLTPPLLFPACRINQSHPPYVLLFTLGMVAANINFAKGALLSKLCDRLAWGPIAGALSACFLAVILLAPFDRRTQEMAGVPTWLMDVLVGAAAACWLVYFTRVVLAGRAPGVALRLLHAPALTWISVFSYSLYLIHFPILDRLSFLAAQFHLSVNAQLGVLLLVGMPVTIGCSYLFHLAFERRFLTPAAGSASALSQPKAQSSARREALGQGMAQA